MDDEVNLIYSAFSAGDFSLAISLFEVMPEILPADAVRLHTTVAQCHFRLSQPDLAAVHFRKAASFAPDTKLQLPLYELAFEFFRRAGNVHEALVVAETILKGNPRHQLAALFYRHHLLDFLMLKKLKQSNGEVLVGIEAADEFFLATELPFNFIHWCGDERLIARILGEGRPHFSQETRAERYGRPHAFGRKIRLGYLSNDFSHAHATMILLRGVLELHDADAFDMTLYCYTDDSIKANDVGFRSSVKRMVELNDLTDQQAVERIRSDQIDILVDLKGHTKNARLGIVNSGCAPIQVGWLGFPGSGTGLDYDYIIGDPIVTPDSSKPYYHEKFCRLPESYQPNDSIHRPLPPPMSRDALSLPGDAVVFASFSSVKKISHDVFLSWAKILSEVPQGILWMMCSNEIARRNFLELMNEQGIPSFRIIFTTIQPYDQHIARLQAADIVLDTFPFNGHTTTSDALWAGVPVVSLKGSSFASRVSESLLTAVGLPELVAEDLDGYVNLAVELAKDPARLALVRQTLAANRFIRPLFDTERFTRHLERAYQHMVQRARAGQPPDHFDVPPMPARTVPFR